MLFPIARGLDIRGHVLGDMLNLALRVHHEEESLKGLQNEEPVDLVGQYRGPRRGDLTLLDGVVTLGRVLALLYIPDLVDRLLQNGAFVRFHR